MLPALTKIMFCEFRRRIFPLSSPRALFHKPTNLKIFDDEEIDEPMPSNPETFASFGKTILMDDSTADFIIRCKTREFKVHKTILCARSPVLRASILSDMKEAKKREIYVEEIDEKTLGSVINFIYTGELDLGEEPDVQMLAWAGNKYLLPRFMEVLCYELRGEWSTGEMVADILISAHLYDSKDLKEVALGKIRRRRGLLKEAGFEKVMKEENSTRGRDIMLDLVKDL